MTVTISRVSPDDNGKWVELLGTTSGAGALTVESTEKFTGFVYAVQTIQGTLDSGVGYTITSTLTTESGATIVLPILVNAGITASSLRYPRVATNKTEDGAALTSAAGGDRDMCIVDGTIKMVLASGGATKTGGCRVYITNFGR